MNTVGGRLHNHSLKYDPLILNNGFRSDKLKLLIISKYFVKFGNIWKHRNLFIRSHTLNNYIFSFNYSEVNVRIHYTLEPIIDAQIFCQNVVSTKII